MTIGLCMSRVALIEDSQEDAIAILLVLARFGISVHHFSGSPEDLPDQPIRGIRMVILDLRLADATGEERQHDPAINVLARIVGRSSVGVGLLLWTRHEDEVQMFKDRLAEMLPEFIPAFVEQLPDKAGWVDRARAEDDLNGLIAHFRQSARLTRGGQLLLAWEQAAFDSASGTVSRIIQFAREVVPAGEQEDGLLYMSALVAKASLDHPNAGNSESLNALLAGLNAIQSDELQRRSRTVVSDTGHVLDLTRKISNLPARTAAQKECINAYLLLATTNGEVQPITPGSIVDARIAPGAPNPFLGTGIAPDDIVRYTSNINNDADIKRLNRELRERTQRGEDVEETNRAIRQRWEVVSAPIRPILLEVTPLCDYFQRNQKVLRLVGGVFIPSGSEALLLNKGDSLQQFGPIRVTLAGVERGYYLVLNYRFLFAFHSPEPIQLPLLARLRLPVLFSVQSRLAAHQSRIGVAELD